MAFVPQNKFETSLVNASIDPSTIPQFYEDFIDSEVFLIQDNLETKFMPNDTSFASKKMEIQQIELNGKMYIPVFSSAERIQAAIKSEVGYYGIKAIELLRATNGAELLLNPGSELGKEFSTQEILSILDGTIWDS